VDSLPSRVVSVRGRVPARRARSRETQQEGLEGLNGRPQWIGDSVDAASATPGREPFGVVVGQCQPMLGEEGLQPSGQ